jgi:reactive intermediate/imine deaminase
VSDSRYSSQFINPPGLAAPTGYSHVVVASGGKTIYISGQVAFDADRNLVGKGDLRAQAHQVFSNLKTALAAAGADFSHVVKMTTFVKDISQMAIVREVRDQYLNGPKPPASSAVEVSRLVNEDWLIEIEAVAVVLE